MFLEGTLPGSDQDKRDSPSKEPGEGSEREKERARGKNQATE
jgi:hypothetical protein